jgi:putative spermidine/putrescine transport system permease protein
MSGVLNGGLLVFSTVFAEFTLANLLVGSRFKTFPIYLVGSRALTRVRRARSR